ncbi:MAG: PfkB family carbohydrate kinase [Planctomycetota bacterium]|nr:PfkB family carbohydrate kinase [Planctomycetota bacterium]
MILVAGLSPAWQQIVLLDSLRVGEVNRARAAHWCASGKVLNVGVALAHLERASLELAGLPRNHQGMSGAGSPSELDADRFGHAAETLAIVGGPAGDEIRREFETLGVPALWIESMAGTRVCTTLLDAATRETTEIVENARAITPAELGRFQSAFRDELENASVVVLAGSFPPGTPTELYAHLMRDSPARVVIDAQGPPLLAALSSRPFLIKPNREELGRTLGDPLTTDAALRDALRECHTRGAEWVVVTQGAKPVWVSSVDQLFLLKPPHVEVVNPIGCGDCLAAGIAWGLSAGWDVVDAVRLGMAAAADNAGQLLPARLVGSRVVSLFHQVEVQSL